MSGARAVTSLELRRHLRSTLTQSPRGQQPPGTTASPTSPLKIPKRITKVRRDLFGPIDRDECNRFIDAELNRKQTIDSERWGFDFANGVPLYNNENFEWEPVYNFLPNYYSQSHHQRQPDPAALGTVSTSSGHYFQEPSDFDASLDSTESDHHLNQQTGTDEQIIVIDSAAKQLNEIDLDAAVLVGGSERTPLQNHNSNQQPYRKFRQLSITDLMRNRKRFATALNSSPVKKTTATMTSTTATATITSSPSQPQSSGMTTSSSKMVAPSTTITTATAAAATETTASRRMSYDSRRTAKKLKFSHETQTK